ESTREGWAAAHRAARPVPPEGYPREGLAGGLMEVALTCLAKNPGERPQDFGQLIHRLQQLSKEHDFLGGFMMMSESANKKFGWDSMAKEVRPRIIHALLKLGEHELALREVEDIPAEDYDGKLWALRGTALSMNNKDEEAITSFERALGSDLGKE